VSWSTRASAVAVLKAQTKFRMAKAEVGRLPRIWGPLTIRNEGRLVIGDRFLLDSGGYRSQLAVGPAGTMSFGDDVFVNQGADVWAARSVLIGDRVLIGPHATIVDDSAHDVAPGIPRRVEPVVIESDVWLGRRCLVLPGVTVGRFSVVGAGAVVSRDVPPCSVVAGVPARVVRTFDRPPDDFRR
jgi:acetyltransferase-like isoleucine patch superfamily enzyme